jgi:hypothetical protein
VRVFWRWLTAPCLSVADVMLPVTAVIAGTVFKVWSGLPWWVVLLVVCGAFALAAFGTGFVRGFCRSVLYDVRRWRARR